MAWLLALLVAAAYAGYTARAVPLVKQQVFAFSTLKWLGIWVAVVSGIVEEVVFRKLLMDWVASWGAQVVWQVLISAVVFGLAHAAWILLRGELAVGVPVVGSTAILGALLAIVYLVAGRNVLPAIVAHTLINVVIEPWLILAAMSGQLTQQRSPFAH